MSKIIYLFLIFSFSLLAEADYKTIYLRLNRKNLVLKKNEKKYFYKRDRWQSSLANLSLPIQGAHYCELSRTREQRRQKKIKIKKSDKKIIEFFYAGGKQGNQVLHYISREYNLTLKCKETMMPPIEYEGSDISLIKKNLKKYFDVGECLITDNTSQGERIVEGLSLNEEVLTKHRKKKKYTNDEFKSKKDWVQERGLGGKRYQCLNK